ncbi:TPA: hypothetical protein L3524_004930, partial [Escherichia coli]|nr:hypothetical protein [Escherichia coli]
MNIRIRSGILPCMDISALNTTNDIEKLRAMALAMVQKVMSENAEKERELNRPGFPGEYFICELRL